ncbi:MAG: Ktr system potassium transporter [Burkholderia sp.]|nr:Ktr system potassium transporter [Burkholderia sp.]
MRQSPTPEVFRDIEKQILRLTPPQVLVLSFLGLSLFGTLLLKLPAATQQPTSWMQALFTAVSASTVTGLAVVDTGTHFTQFGQWVLLFLMQSGGLGLMTFGVFVIYLTNGQMTLRHRAALREALNQTGPGDLRRVLISIFGFTAIMEIVGTALLALHWVPEMGWSRGLFYSFFHAVSAFNSAGFGLPGNSLTNYVGSPLVNSIISALFITGGIGFVVLADMLGKKRFRAYSLHTKLMLVGTLVINVVAMLVILLLEHGNPATLAALPDMGTRLWAAWFQAVSPRSAGFNTIDIGAMMPATVFFMMGLMFIGGGSGSTAGGVKLSTFIVLLLATRAFLREQERPVVFGRSIPPNVILKALAITVISLFCVMTGVFALMVTEGGGNFLDLAFEAVSAFGTVGLSRGVTAELSTAGQLVVILLMLIGRVGPLTLAFTLANVRRERIQYPSGQLNVG